MSWKKSLANTCLFITVAEVLTTGIGAAAGAVGSAVMTEAGYPGYVAATAAAQLAIGNAVLSVPLYTCCTAPCFWSNEDDNMGAAESEWKNGEVKRFPNPMKVCIAMNTIISLALAPLAGNSLYAAEGEAASMDLAELKAANGVGLGIIAGSTLTLACLATCLFVAVRIGGIFVNDCFEDCKDRLATRDDGEAIPLKTAGGEPTSYSGTQPAF